ncbi:chemotaxis protein CheB [Methylobacterium soli]|uniref:protein-glutamate methylesterase n=1 Tax=Methylobacterium soli TaxID=553447 RepID=A0A6L3SU27_9HYPH|nr:chemotaxis protein CheB [Methylobacterium soli]KAB1077097.1 chemotaxis protein CheB [Methylobacterium soli]GJE45012.1 Protein-glutamate methylesterase/protein-glutamine glutaminase [Methylobacterium soli]
MLVCDPEDYASIDFFVAIGASGPRGLNDIERLLARLPPDLRAVVLIVLHRPWDRVSYLREVLNRHSAIPIHIAEDGERLRNGYGYIGEPGAHLALAANSLGDLIADPRNLHRNRTVDALFRSVAAHARGRFIGVVLSGALDDGSRGLAAIHEAGGVTMVLTPHDPPGRGMPENAIGYDGPIDFIGTPEAIAANIVERVQAREPARRTTE